jgi:hypothetical protein
MWTFKARCGYAGVSSSLARSELFTFERGAHGDETPQNFCIAARSPECETGSSFRVQSGAP